jgi:hypothetical protein
MSSHCLRIWLLQGLIQFDVAELVSVMRSAALTADGVLVQMCRKTMLNVIQQLHKWLH